MNETMRVPLGPATDAQETLTATITIELRDHRGTYTTTEGAPITEYTELAMQGIIRNERHQMISAGQCQDTLVSLYPNAARLLAIWEAWHLNGTTPGCVHQSGWEHARLDNGNLAMWTRPNEDPKGLLLKACPTCGYLYGSAWLVRQLPQSIIDELHQIIDNWPDASRWPSVRD